MCLSVNLQRHHRRDNNIYGRLAAEPFVADRPLIIKKRVRIHKIDSTRFQYRSPYFDTIIKMKHEYSCSMSARDTGHRTTVEQGFHAYLLTASPVDWLMRPTLMKNNIVTIYGVIPVGAKYFIGKDKEVVSDKVIYFETLQEIADYYNVKKLADPHKGDYNGK